ncbi:MAG: ABC transporter transmembrane domain-containing protein [Ahrensia sp.]|nr:ABC transporter transmembrane domain-containing protein [Ahrensia sp.]
MRENDLNLYTDAAVAISTLASSFGLNAAPERLRQEVTSGQNDGSAVVQFANAAGVVLEPIDSDLWSLRSSQCPVLTQITNGNFIVINDVAHGGLAVCVDTSGKSAPFHLSMFPTGTVQRVWRVRPLLGDERNKIGPEAALIAPLWRAFLPGRSILLPVMLATITINVLALAIPLATMNIFDRVISNAAFNTLWALVIGVVLAASLDFLLRNLRALVMDRASAASDIAVSNSVFGRILGARSSARTASVGIQANALREFEGIREYFNSVAMATLGDLPFVALFLFVIWLVAGTLVVVPMLAIPVIFIAAGIIQNRLRKLVEGGFQDTAHKNSVAIEIAGGIEAIKIAGAEEWAARQWERATASQTRHSLAIRFWTATSIHLVGFFQGITTIGVLAAGVYMVTAGDITPGALFAANMLTARCLGPVAALAALISRLHQVKTAYRSVQALCSMEQERPPERQMLTPTAFRGKFVSTMLSIPTPLSKRLCCVT